ncbi:ABC transporter permease [Chelativorans xinjiangense]|uniref:ABC transporter permease n=1 Tax=Chelativorans xinjiangense TaxID=2681485 RepID=UPI00135A6530|nr:ABC transporter permease [Chelativorans xinjiangense]
MLFYAAKRIGLTAVIVTAIVFTLFCLIHLIPGDPAAVALGPYATPEMEARFIEKMQLDKPVHVRFLSFAWNALQGNLGEDIFSERPVSRIVAEALPYTIALAFASLGWAILIGIPLGCFSAAHPNSWIDRLTGVISIATITIPSFVVSIYSLLIFSVTLRWFPVIGAGEAGDLGDQLWHLVLPAFAVGLGWVGYLARMVRASMLEVLGETHIRSARAFGLPERVVVYRYALRVAILPTVTLLGMGFGSAFSGAVFAEIIFSRPGIGKLIYDMVVARNYPVVQGGVMTAAILFVTATLIADLVAAALDPRMRANL